MPYKVEYIPDIYSGDPPYVAWDMQDFLNKLETEGWRLVQIINRGERQLAVLERAGQIPSGASEALCRGPRGVLTITPLSDAGS